jgi:hypothetical protein
LGAGKCLASNYHVSINKLIKKKTTVKGTREEKKKD